MDFSRRNMLSAALFGTAASAAALASGEAQAQARPTALGTFGLDAATLGLRAGAVEDQSKTLQNALLEAAKRNTPLMVQPGRYRVSGVILPEGVRLMGVPNATQFIPAQAGPMFIARRIKRAAVVGIELDGLAMKAEDRSGLLFVDEVADFTLQETGFANAGSVGLVLNRVGGRIQQARFRLMRDAALFSMDARGLTIDGNTVEDCGNNGIQIWRSNPGDDASVVRGNRISRIRNDAGGDGPNGNGISLYKAGGVLVEGNTLRDCALTFIRNNSGSAVQIIGNQGRRCGEVALYSEFAFEGAIISNNLVDEVAQGVNITNLDHGGRLAICSNNLIRTVRKGLAPKGKEIIGGIGIHVEAEAAVTGNVIESVSDVGISLGWAWGMRNLVATGNMIRDARMGISVSLVPKERNALIANNVISGAKIGAIVGTEYGKAVTGDLARGPDPKASGVRIEGNAVG